MQRDEATTSQLKFGMAVRRRRIAIGISQEKLGELAGLHRTYVGDIELGKRNVSLQNIIKLATALGTTPPELLSSFGEQKHGKCGGRT